MASYRLKADYGNGDMAWIDRFLSLDEVRESWELHVGKMKDEHIAFLLDGHPEYIDTGIYYFEIDTGEDEDFDLMNS